MSKNKQKAALMEKMERIADPSKIELTIENIDQFKEKPGRPIDPNSERQIKLKELEVKREQGLLKRGRPANPDSEHAKKKAEQEARKADPNYIARRGRPVDPDSKRQHDEYEKKQRKLARLKANPGLILAMVTEKEAKQEVI